uniref:PSI domain-containing protein n=1 Tax=Palpitomonas bilix TaxID=652834 RepID=A0A7S3CXY8_9EUKA|mmetsp:Transcript_14304/g.36416  ORF Transcript_14304/g.36416 Transcript_14304/m.36416 type:complete len:207 (+) Transcript_14304:317-937(+)
MNKWGLIALALLVCAQLAYTSNNDKDVCNFRVTCGLCTQAGSGCGWCKSSDGTSVCENGTVVGPYSNASACSTTATRKGTWVTQADGCDLLCSQSKTCDSCLTSLSCGYCYSNSKCIAANISLQEGSAFPLQQSCNAFEFDSCFSQGLVSIILLYSIIPLLIIFILIGLIVFFCYRELKPKREIKAKAEEEEKETLKSTHLHFLYE